MVKTADLRKKDEAALLKDLEESRVSVALYNFTQISHFLTSNRNNFPK